MEKPRKKTLLLRMADAGNRKLPRNVYVMLLVSSVLLAFGMRLLQFHLEPLISRDGTIYIRLAEQWAVSGDYPRHAYLPLLPWMMKMLFYTGLSLHAAGIAVNLVFGSLLPLVAWGILRQLTSCREIALGAAFLMAFHPSAIGLSADVTRDTLYLFTGGSAVLFALYGIRSGKWQGWCFSALFLAFGLFVRYEILELVPLTVACFLIAPAVRSISLKTALANFAVWGGTFLISALDIALLTGVLPQTAAAYNERIQRISIQKI